MPLIVLWRLAIAFILLKDDTLLIQEDAKYMN